MGGDEFAVLADCPVPDDDGALAGRLGAAVAQAGAGCRVTASVGCAPVHPDDDVAGVLHRADAAMYLARRPAGTGCTTSHGDGHARVQVTHRDDRAGVLRGAQPGHDPP